MVEIEAIFDEIGNCSRKMNHYTKFIDFFVGDILDFSVLNEASSNFKKHFKTFDIRKAITTVVEMIKDKSNIKTISIQTEMLYENNGDKSHYINTD